MVADILEIAPLIGATCLDHTALGINHLFFLAGLIEQIIDARLL